MRRKKKRKKGEKKSDQFSLTASNYLVTPHERDWPAVKASAFTSDAKAISTFQNVAVQYIHLLLSVTHQTKMRPLGRTFVISGGCSGLGLAAARDLVKAGAYVALLDLNAEAGENITKEFGDKSIFFETDVSDTSSVEAAVKGSVEWVKKTGKPIGGVVAAAGVGSAAKVCHKKNTEKRLQRTDACVIDLRRPIRIARLNFSN